MATCILQDVPMLRTLCLLCMGLLALSLSANPLHGQNTIRYSASGTNSADDHADFLFEWGGAEIVSASGETPITLEAACAKGYANLPTMYSQPFEITPSQAVMLDMSYRLSITPGPNGRGGVMVILIELVDAVTDEDLGRVGIEHLSIREREDFDRSSLQHLRIECDPAWFTSGDSRKVKLRAVFDVAPVVHDATIEEYADRTAMEIMEIE